MPTFGRIAGAADLIGIGGDDGSGAGSGSGGAGERSETSA